MKVSELIAALNELDADSDVTIKVYTQTQAYPQAYTKVDIVKRWNAGAEICTWLAKGQSISTRKRDDL